MTAGGRRLVLVGRVLGAALLAWCVVCGVCKTAGVFADETNGKVRLAYPANAFTVSEGSGASISVLGAANGFQTAWVFPEGSINRVQATFVVPEDYDAVDGMDIDIYWSHQTAANCTYRMQTQPKQIADNSNPLGTQVFTSAVVGGAFYNDTNLHKANVGTAGFTNSDRGKLMRMAWGRDAVNTSQDTCTDSIRVYAVTFTYVSRLLYDGGTNPYHTVAAGGPGASGAPGATGAPGAACYEYTGDSNGDSTVSLEDCLGMTPSQAASTVTAVQSSAIASDRIELFMFVVAGAILALLVATCIGYLRR